MDIVKIGIIGVLGALLAIQFKSEKSEYGTYIAVAVSLFIFFNITLRLRVIVDTIEDISSGLQIKTSYMVTLLKILGITYVAEFASFICKDSGYQAIAQQIEIFSKLTILALSMPILTALLTTIREFLT
ncbi:MAG: SpoIIIAC/SpoIIIAD family protein [Lachnospiraceae bacterium]